MPTIAGAGILSLPGEPMAPVTNEQIPEGNDWGYQIKWDGVRLLVRIVDGQVELFSRKGLLKNSAYPELAKLFSSMSGSFLLDGEAFVFDNAKGRPLFRKVLQRERLRQPGAIQRAAAAEPVRFALFDVLASEGKNWRDRPYVERHHELQRLFPEKQERLFVTDLFADGKALWNWVSTNGWEGMVSKRLSSSYREGKKHRDWLKKKTALVEEVDIVALTYNSGRVASLVMAMDGQYFGRVSLGLNEDLKGKLAALDQFSNKQGPASLTAPLVSSGFSNPIHPDLKGLDIRWLAAPFRCTVTGLEVTDAGLLRHSKLVRMPVL